MASGQDQKPSTSCHGQGIKIEPEMDVDDFKFKDYPTHPSLSLPDSKQQFHYRQLFPHMYLPTAAVLPHSSCAYSQNCVNFNRLFHSSFDDEEKSVVKRDTDSDTKIKVESDTDQPAIEIKTEHGMKTKLNPSPPHITASEHKSDDEVMDIDGDIDEPVSPSKQGRTGQRKSTRVPQPLPSDKTQEAQIMRRITLVFKKEPKALTDEDKSLLDAFPTLVRIVRKRFEARLLSTERLKEFEDSTEVIEAKCNQLAEIIAKAKYLVVYSGAGISTSANIPDFRGTTGLWTMLKNGQSADTQSVDTQVLTSADPTMTHMALRHLYAEGIVKHIVSQNCDGLHLRSGIPKMGLSEIHGNMYIEVCGKCGRDYVRTFDVAENTRRHEHRTGRRCYNCRTPLRDTIVHFGERGKLRWPINWAGAEYNAHRADVILCIGSSLKVLRRYPWLWCMDKPAVKRPKLVIVNLMWTPKDQFAALKIHGRCDDIMTRVMIKLNMTVPIYSRLADPLFRIATPLHLSEVRTRASRELAFPENEPMPLKLVDMNNYVQFEPVFRICSGANSSDDDPSDHDHERVRDPDPKVKARSGVKHKKKKVSSDRNRVIKSGTGNGWLGNLTPGVKVKKKKVK